LVYYLHNLFWLLSKNHIVFFFKAPLPQVTSCWEKAQSGSFTVWLNKEHLLLTWIKRNFELIASTGWPLLAPITSIRQWSLVSTVFKLPYPVASYWKSCWETGGLLNLSLIIIMMEKNFTEIICYIIINI